MTNERTIMNKKLTVAITLAGALSLIPGYAQSSRSSQSQRGDTNEPATASTQRSEMSGKTFNAFRASDIVGKNVKSAQSKENIGEVDDLAVDLESGHIAAVILSQGGALGVGGKLIAVPTQAFMMTSTGDRSSDRQLVLNVPADKLQSAPAFRWESATRDSLTTTFQHFGQAPYWQSGEGASRQPVRESESPSTSSSQSTSPSSSQASKDQSASAKGGQLRKASDVIGMDVRDNRATDLGEINDLAVDLTSGRIVAAIIASGGILGLGETLHAVPPSQLKFSAEKDKLTASFAKDKLDRAPKFSSNMWNTLNDPKWATDVYSYYQETPFWQSDMQRVRDPNQQLQRQQDLPKPQPQTPQTPQTPTPQTPEQPSTPPLERNPSQNTPPPSTP